MRVQDALRRAIPLLQDAEIEDAARERFAKLDANGDGLISKDEIDDHKGHRRGHQ